MGQTRHPIPPFDRTGDLYFLDSGCGCVLSLSGLGDTGGEPSLRIAITRHVQALTGADKVDFERRGNDSASCGNLYFSEGESASILVPQAGSVPRIPVNQTDLLRAGALEAFAQVDPAGLAFGSDGKLYVADGVSDAVFQIDPIPEEGLPAVALWVTSGGFLEAAGKMRTVNPAGAQTRSKGGG